MSFHLSMDIWLFSVFGYTEQSCFEHFVCKSLLRQMFSFFLDKYLWVELLGHLVSVCLMLEETSKVLSEVVVPFCILTPVYNSSSSYMSTYCFKAE